MCDFNLYGGKTHPTVSGPNLAFDYCVNCLMVRCTNCTISSNRLNATNIVNSVGNNSAGNSGVDASFLAVLFTELPMIELPMLSALGYIYKYYQLSPDLQAGVILFRIRVKNFSKNYYKAIAINFVVLSLLLGYCLY